jgi:hypothetical protein
MNARRHVAGGTGRWTRTAISSQVAFAILLAAAAALLVSWLAAQPMLRKRFDLTRVRSNTLDETLGGLIGKLPERATVEVFFRPVDPPLTNVGAQAQMRMAELLTVARNQFPDKLWVEHHDLSDVAKVSARMKELGVQEDNVVVVQLGERKTVLKLLRDIARVDPGNPAMRKEPSLESFRGEEALGNALLRVSVGETPRIVFTSGHGERDLFDVEQSGALGSLHSALAADGFRVERWDSAERPELPAGARVVAIVDARQPLQDREREQIREFVESGGRLFVAATGNDKTLHAEGGAAKLLEEFGIRTAPGLIAQMLPDGFGGARVGTEANSLIVVSGAGIEPRHPITESLARFGILVGLPTVRALDAPREDWPRDAVVYDLLRTPEASWRDLPDVQGRQDWKPAAHEETGPFAVAIAMAFPPPAAPAPAGAAAERPASRIVAIGSVEALSNQYFGNGRNRDFVLNSFNWLAERDARLVVRPRSTERPRLDVRNTNALSVLNGVALLGLPGLSALLGILLAWRRRR